MVKRIKIGWGGQGLHVSKYTLEVTFVPFCSSLNLRQKLMRLGAIIILTSTLLVSISFVCHRPKLRTFA